MELTKEQIAYLAKIADAGIAEEMETKARNEQIDKETKILQARQEKEQELKAQADALIEAGLSDFETNIAPTIE